MSRVSVSPMQSKKKVIIYKRENKSIVLMFNRKQTTNITYLTLTQAGFLILDKYVWYGMFQWARLISFNQKKSEKKKKK